MLRDRDLVGSKNSERRMSRIRWLGLVSDAVTSLNLISEACLAKPFSAMRDSG